jgi:hypothetical protein
MLSAAKNARNGTMKNKDVLEKLWDIISEYNKNVIAELYERWKLWKYSKRNREKHEVIGGLLSRQVTLATQLANSPSVWNAHIAPVILQAMTNAYIMLAWIFEDPNERARKFIACGIEREKLAITYLKTYLQSLGREPNKDEMLKKREVWLNSQRYPFLSKLKEKVSHDKDNKTMAEEAGCTDLYEFSDTYFNAAMQSTWDHIARYNLSLSATPPEEYHRIPIVTSMDPNFDYLHRAAEYVEKSFGLFDEKTSVKTKLPSAFELLNNALESLAENAE